MLNRMGKSEGCIVKQMLYEPCLFTVLIPDDPAETKEKKKNAGSDESGYRKSYLLIHTDDIDGAAEDPRDGDAILNAFDKEFGITLCESRFMLAVQREITVGRKIFILGAHSLQSMDVATIVAALVDPRPVEDSSPLPGCETSASRLSIATIRSSIRSTALATPSNFCIMSWSIASIGDAALLRRHLFRQHAPRKESEAKGK